MSVRDIQADYRRAYLEEYEGYRRAGDAEAAGRIAGILRDHYGHDVAKDAIGGKAETPRTERADRKAPEDTAEHSPAPRRSARSKKAEQ